METKRWFEIFNGIMIIFFVFPLIQTTGIFILYNLLIWGILKGYLTNIEFLITILSYGIGLVYILMWIFIKGLSYFEKKKEKENVR